MKCATFGHDPKICPLNPKVTSHWVLKKGNHDDDTEMERKDSEQGRINAEEMIRQNLGDEHKIELVKEREKVKSPENIQDDTVTENQDE